MSNYIKEIHSVSQLNVNHLTVSNVYLSSINYLNKSFLNPGLYESPRSVLHSNFVYNSKNKNNFITRKIEEDIFKFINGNRGQIVFLNGKSGSGKTTSIRKIIENLLNPQDLNKILFFNFEDLMKSDISFLNNFSDECFYHIFIDKFNFDKEVFNKEISNNGQILFDELFKKENFNLILSPFRTINDDKQESLNNFFIDLMENSGFQNFRIFDASTYPEYDRELLIQTYNNNYANGVNANKILNLLNKNISLALISALVFNDTDLKDTFLNSLKSKNQVIHPEYNIKLSDFLSIIYLFTKFKEPIWINDIGREKVELLQQNIFFNIGSETIEGISEFYDEMFFDILKEQFKSEDDFFRSIISNIITFYDSISDLLKLFKKYKFTSQDFFEKTIFNNFQTVIKKCNVYDLLDIKIFISSSELLCQDEKEYFFEIIIDYLWQIEIKDKKALTKFRLLVKELYYLTNSDKLSNLNLSLNQFKNNENKFDLTLLLDSLNQEDIRKKLAMYLLSEPIQYHINYESEEKIKEIIDSLYENIYNLSHIEELIFFKFFVIFFKNKNKYEILNIYNYDKIKSLYDILLHKRKFNSYNFSRFNSFILKKGLFEPLYIDIIDILQKKLKNEYVILHMLFKNKLVPNELIKDIINHLNSYYRQNPYMILMFIINYDKTLVIENDNRIIPMISTILNQCINMTDLYFNIKDNHYIKSNSLIGQTLFNENIITELILHYDAPSLAQKLLNVYSIIDWNKNKFLLKKINEEKYFKLLGLSFKDISLMLYTEHKNFIFNKNLNQYNKFRSLKIKNHHKKYIKKIGSKEEFRKRKEIAFNIFTLLSRYYLQNQNISCHKNIMANILKGTNYRTKVGEIEKLFIDGYNEEKIRELKEKNIIDLLNYYYEMKEYKKYNQILDEYENKITINRFKDIFSKFNKIN